MLGKPVNPMSKNIQPGCFEVSNQVIAVVVLQYSFAEHVDTEDEDILNRLTELATSHGFPKFVPAEQRSVQINSQNKPQESRTSVLRFLDEAMRKGVSLSRDSVVYFACDHPSYEASFGLFEKFVDSVAPLIGGPSLSGLGLRYVNIIPQSLSRSPLVPGVSGLKTSGILSEFTHSHAKSEYWCETRDGRLFVKTATKHGTTLPDSLGYADIVFDKTRLTSFNEMVVHLDIFETSTYQDAIQLTEAKGKMSDVRLRISQAFLDILSDQGKIDLGVEPK